MSASSLGGIGSAIGTMSTGPSPLDILKAAGSAKPRAQSNAAKANLDETQFSRIGKTVLELITPEICCSCFNKAEEETINFILQLV